ncbi:MAG TPA: tetratricopeptide repeat protein [Fluviicola sp.]|nr:tetratricopeptide repeat protein [Fluviicola sp.]
MEHWTNCYNEGISLKEAKRFEESLALHLKVLAIEPELKMPEAWHNVGAAYLRLGRSGEAVPYLRKAIELYDRLIYQMHYSQPDEWGKSEENDSHKQSESAWLDDDPVIDNEEFYGDEPVAYYLFWKSCCFALLNEKEPFLESLTQSIAKDDWYALEAATEEDLVAFREDPDLRKLIDPIIARINAPDHPHLYDIFDRIEKRILIGFEDPEEFIPDVVHEVTEKQWKAPVPTSWIRKTALQLHANHLAKSKEWPAETDVKRLAEVFNTLCKDGILALHRPGYTREDAIEEVFSVMEDMVLSPDLIKGFCFYCGENVDKLIYSDGTLHIGFNSILIDDAPYAVAIGNTIVQRLREKGFVVEWDGKMESCIRVLNFQWKKVFISDEDQQLWDHWRVFDLF